MSRQKRKRPTVVPPRKRQRSVRAHDRRVQIVRGFLESSFQRKLNLRKMGAEVNLSPWRLAHLFKAETGMSLQRYLRLVRLQRARDQLTKSFRSIREIGAAVGIPNPSHFTKSFKAAYGMTPAEYRRAYLELPVYRDGEIKGAAQISQLPSPTS